MREATIFSLLLDELGVKHTTPFSDCQFKNMSFKSLFGFSKLLRSYGIDSEGVAFDDKTSGLQQLQIPFLAQIDHSFQIVTDVRNDSVDLLSVDGRKTVSKSDFLDRWTGTAFAVYTSEASIEPDYSLHEREIIINDVKKWGLVAFSFLLWIYLFITNRVYSSIPMILVMLFDLCGLYVTYLLVQKSLKINNATADKFCGVLAEHGCDHVLELKASKFFGIFGWSEVGFAYFGVSLLCLMIFPQWVNYLAICNLLCLPFSFWSIWYQKFRAHTWCTLCVTVQCLLWILFFCYLLGGYFHGIFPLKIEFFILGITYLTALLALNRLLPHFDKSSVNS